jgi:Peptidase family M23
MFDPLAMIAYGDRKMAPVTEMSEQQPLTDARRRTRPRSGLQPAATVSGPRVDRNATVELMRDGRAAMDELAHPVVVEFPLRGEWLVERTPSFRIPSHGTDALGQRFAYDFVRTDHRAGLHLHPAGSVRWYLIGGRTRDCYGWGQPVHAAFDGQVTARRGWRTGASVGECRARIVVCAEERVGLPARQARPRSPRREPRDHPERGVFALFAHLASGSITVTAGQVLRAGEEIGRVGHTGNSTAPHLHFQLMDGADPLQAKGLACAFAEYLAQRGGRWERVTSCIPSRMERICSIS